MENRSNRILHVVIIWLTFVGSTLGADTKPANPLSIGEHTVELNGIKLWYKVSGTGPVCLMPSPPQACGSDWYFNTLGSMEKLFTMVYLDSRGTGRSEKPSTLYEYTWDHLVEDLEALRVHLKQDAVWLMGNSAGGISAQFYACKYPNKTRGLVLLASMGFGGDEWSSDVESRMNRMKRDPVFSDAIKAWDENWGWLNQLELSELMKVSDEKMTELTAEFSAVYWSDPNKAKQVQGPSESVKNSVAAWAGSKVCQRTQFDLRSEMHKVTAPVLIVVGDDDCICSPVQATAMHLGYPNSKMLLIEQCGHFAWIEQKEIFDKRVPEFLQAMGLSVPRPAESAQVPEIEDKLPIIDMHAHAFPASGEKDYYGNVATGNAEEQFQQTYEQFRKWHVVKAVVSGPLECVEIWKSKDVDNRIVPGIFMESPDLDYASPEKGGIEIGRFEKLVKNGKIKVFGEIGPIYGGTTLNDPGWQPYLTICALNDIPVNVHVGDMAPGVHSWSPKARLSLGDPYLIEDVLLRYPKLRVYLAHAGIEWHDHTLSLMKAHPNLYTDLSCLLWINQMCKRIGREFLAKAKEDELLGRVMFGSDQIVWPHGIEMSIEYLNSLAFLTEQDKRDILYNNAARFLGLDQESQD